MNQPGGWIFSVVGIIVSALTGAIGTLVAVRNTATTANSTVLVGLIAALTKRVSDLEAEMDASKQRELTKDLKLVELTQSTSDARAAEIVAKASEAFQKDRADRFEQLSTGLQEDRDQLREQLDRLEHAVRKIISTQRLTKEDREQLLHALDGSAASGEESNDAS